MLIFSPFTPRIKLVLQITSVNIWKKKKPVKSTQNIRLICDWTDKWNCLLPSRELKFYLGHGMVHDEIHDIMSLRQNR